MAASKQDMRVQIKLLRRQMADLEDKCKEREDKLINLVFVLEPFLNELSPEIHDQILEKINYT